MVRSSMITAYSPQQMISNIASSLRTLGEAGDKYAKEQAQDKKAQLAQNFFVAAAYIESTVKILVQRQMQMVVNNAAQYAKTVGAANFRSQKELDYFVNQVFDHKISVAKELRKELHADLRQNVALRRQVRVLESSLKSAKKNAMKAVQKRSK